jgi:hypothetical protein
MAGNLRRSPILRTMVTIESAYSERHMHRLASGTCPQARIQVQVQVQIQVAVHGVGQMQVQAAQRVLQRVPSAGFAERYAGSKV